MIKRVADVVLRNGYTAQLFRYLEQVRYDDRYDSYREAYDIDPAFQFNGKWIAMYGDGEIRCGPDSYIGKGSHLQAKAGQTITIGSNAAISHRVMMYTGSSVPDQDMSTEKRKLAADIDVEDHTWIGANVFITPGSRVGENAVVGANSVVTRDVPAHTIAAGSPAKVIDFKSYLEDSEVERIAAEHWDALSADLQSDLRSRVDRD